MRVLWTCTSVSTESVVGFAPAAPAGPRPDGEEGTAAVEEPGPDRAAEDDAAGDEGAGEHNATDEGQAEGDGGGGEDERGPRGVSDEAEAAPGGEGEEVDGAAGGDGEGAEGVEGGAYEDDELATMKSGARDNITVMCVDGESRASGMYIVPADAVVWDAVLQFVEDQGMDPSGVVVRLRAEAVEVDKPFKLYGVSPGDALELVVYPRGLPPGTEVETEVEDEYRQMLEVEIPPGVDPATGAVVGHGRVVQVLVDWSMQERKKFLGGWRNKVNERISLHDKTRAARRSLPRAALCLVKTREGTVSGCVTCCHPLPCRRSRGWSTTMRRRRRSASPSSRRRTGS